MSSLGPASERMGVARTRLDLSKPADNGLARGMTTGLCATAAVKAAVQMLEYGNCVDEVQVTLPDGEHFISVPISELNANNDGSVSAAVVKHAGDDPDRTDGATIFATVRRNNLGAMRFFAGPGVGTVTEPGIRVAVGEPAINPVPRQMMITAIEESMEGDVNPGYDLTIGCRDGETIAKRTFNPRLGIIGGISIIGTTGIVEPMSLAAYKASIEVYIRVALGDNTKCAAFLPGNIGLTFASQKLKLPRKRIVHISNFVGFSLEAAQSWLLEQNVDLAELWILGHPGKLAKVLDGVWDTHSKSSDVAVESIAKVAAELSADLGIDEASVRAIRECSSVEMLHTRIENREFAPNLWCEVEKRIAAVMKEKVPNVRRLMVGLFNMNGSPLGDAR